MFYKFKKKMSLRASLKKGINVVNNYPRHQF